MCLAGLLLVWLVLRCDDGEGWFGIEILVESLECRVESQLGRLVRLVRSYKKGVSFIKTNKHL